MRPLQMLVTLVLAATILISCQSQAAPPETIVLGRMVTMAHSSHRSVQLPSITAALFRGDQAAALALRGPDTRVIDLEDATAYPGFIDAHLHVAGMGPRSARWISPAPAVSVNS